MAPVLSPSLVEVSGLGVDMNGTGSLTPAGHLFGGGRAYSFSFSMDQTVVVYRAASSIRGIAC